MNKIVQIPSITSNISIHTSILINNRLTMGMSCFSCLPYKTADGCDLKLQKSSKSTTGYWWSGASSSS